MTREEILHLGRLARIRLSEEEVGRFNAEIDAVLDYVGTVQAIAGEPVAGVPEAGPLRNVFRADAVTNTPDEYTERLLGEMPETVGRYLSVKKILDTDNG